jgi:hypothetical protein
MSRVACGSWFDILTGVSFSCDNLLAIEKFRICCECVEGMTGKEEDGSMCCERSCNRGAALPAITPLHPAKSETTSGVGLITGKIDTGNLALATIGYLAVCSEDLRRLRVQVRNGLPEVVRKPVKKFEEGAIWAYCTMCGKTTRHEKQSIGQFSGPTVDDCLTMVVGRNAEADVSGSNELTHSSSEAGDARVGLETYMHRHAELPQALQ